MSELSSASGSKTFLTFGSSSPNLARILLNCETAKRVSPSPAFIHCTRVAERAVRCKTLISFLSSCSLSISASTALSPGGENPPLDISSSDVSAFDRRPGSLRQALLLRLEFFAQQLFCPVQPPFHCRQRQAQEIRDPRQRRRAPRPLQTCRAARAVARTLRYARSAPRPDRSAGCAPAAYAGSSAAPRAGRWRKATRRTSPALQLRATL